MYKKYTLETLRKIKISEGLDTPETSYSFRGNPENPQESRRILAKSLKTLRNPILFTPPNLWESPWIPTNLQESLGIPKNPQESTRILRILRICPLYLWNPCTTISKWCVRTLKNVRDFVKSFRNLRDFMKGMLCLQISAILRENPKFSLIASMREMERKFAWLRDWGPPGWVQFLHCILGCRMFSISQGRGETFDQNISPSSGATKLIFQCIVRANS